MQKTQRAHTVTHTAGVYYISERVKMLIKCVNVKHTAMCDSKMLKTSCFISCFLLPVFYLLVLYQELTLKFLTITSVVLRLRPKS